MPVSPQEIRQKLHAFDLARDRLLIELAREAGLSPIDLHALEHLEAGGPLTPGELQQRVGLTSGSTTALIDRLERAGWVRRAGNPADRRSVLVELTDVAGDAGDAQLGQYHRAIARITRDLSPAERRAVGRFLDAAAAAADRGRQ